MSQSEQFIGVALAAKRKDVSVATVKRAAKNGRLPAIKVEGELGAYVFRASDVDAWDGRSTDRKSAVA